MLMVYHVVWCCDNLEYTPENNSCTNRCNELTINCDYNVISIITINTLNLNVLEYDKWFELPIGLLKKGEKSNSFNVIIQKMLPIKF